MTFFESIDQICKKALSSRIGYLRPTLLPDIVEPYLNQGTKTTYLNKGRWAKLPNTHKIFKKAYISMKLTQNEVINIKF